MKYKTITKNDNYHKGFGIDSIYVVVNDEGMVFKKMFPLHAQLILCLILGDNVCGNNAELLNMLTTYSQKFEG
jgi:hypothetical protein